MNLIVQIAAAIYVLIRGFECALLVLCMPLPLSAGRLMTIQQMSRLPRVVWLDIYCSSND